MSTNTVKQWSNRLEGIPRIGKLKIAVTPRDQYILHLHHDLIFILDSDISTDGSPVISQSHPESERPVRG